MRDAVWGAVAGLLIVLGVVCLAQLGAAAPAASLGVAGFIGVGVAAALVRR